MSTLLTRAIGRVRRMLKLAAMCSLAEIGRRHNTDKVNEQHTFNGKSYLDIYESYLKSLRTSAVNVLELGVLNGSSLRVWRDFFSRGNVYGIDIDPSALAHRSHRIAIEIGSQDDPVFLNAVFPDVDLDLIIDDASHVNTFTVASFQQLFFNRLKPGGLYIIEDLDCSYSKLEAEHSVSANWPGMKFNDPNKSFDNDRSLMDLFFQKLICGMDHHVGEVEFIHFYARVCVIGKRSV
jgi:hypothetical protein